MIGSMARYWGVRFAAACWGLGVLSGFCFVLGACFAAFGLRSASGCFKKWSIDCSSEKYGRIMERISAGDGGGWV